MPATIGVYNADNYTSQADALENGAFYQQSGDWTYDDTTSLEDLLSMCDAINICHNGETDRSKAQFVLVVEDGNEWLLLERWIKVRDDIARKPPMTQADLQNATKIGIVDGITYYENPVNGDEAPLIQVYGSLIGEGHFWELPAEGEY